MTSLVGQGVVNFGMEMLRQGVMESLKINRAGSCRPSLADTAET
jgi:hypothetical protein